MCYAASCEDATGSITYAYDLVGNRTEQIRTGELPAPGVTTYTYDAADQLIETVTGTGADAVRVPYTWDADGNLATAGDTTYQYDVLDRERTQTGPDGTWTTTWDPDSRRMTVYQEGAADAHAFFWDINYPDALPRLAVQADSVGDGRRTWSYAAQDGTSLDTTIGTCPRTARSAPSPPTTMVWSIC